LYQQSVYIFRKVNLPQRVNWEFERKCDVDVPDKEING
jgi:hypothetical protein